MALAGFFIGINTFVTFAAFALRVTNGQDLLKTFNLVGDAVGENENHGNKKGFSNKIFFILLLPICFLRLSIKTKRV